MSRSLGFFADDTPQDYPNLNKCPDCETFFESDACPLCNKVCPEEMRAGNRKPVKQPKRKRNTGNGRVQFVPWYHTTVAILVAFVLQPIIGLILAWTGVWKTRWKIVITVVAALPLIVGYTLGLIALFTPPEPPPVNLEISEFDYKALCAEITDVEHLYRYAGDSSYLGKYVTFEVKITNIVNDHYDYESDYTRYLICDATDANGRTWSFLVQDFRQNDSINLAVGDEIRIWGEILGSGYLEDLTSSATGAYIGAPYIELLP